MNHGHVIPNSNGSQARCGGPSMCPVCARELLEMSNYHNAQTSPSEATKFVQTRSIDSITHNNGIYLAICNDGSAWSTTFDYDDKQMRPWTALPEIPQPESK